MKTRFYIYAMATIIFLLVFPPGAAAKTRHDVYFKNTDYELHVYKIKGSEEGKTLMVIGGIQGDEPGGYLSADLYADMTLRKGNLIVVPRANFLSIIKNQRVINRDMNRRFNYLNDREYYEDKVVEILKSLINESDYLLNLHEGSGFYSDVWESNMVNPMRFGQSVIADADVYSASDGTTLRLGDTVRAITGTVNANIKNPDHHFRFNNHRTFEKNTSHAEQRMSATYYAVSTRGIPAFGIETSKEIKELEKKVRYQTMVVNAFMDQFGIIPENPGIFLETPKLTYLVVQTNGREHMLHNNHTLTLRHGDTFTITDIVANYKRGLSADIIGLGDINDLNHDFTITTPITVEVRKDGFPCGSVKVAVAAASQEDDIAALKAADVPATLAVKYLIVEVNGSKQVINNGERLAIVRGDRLKIADVVLNTTKDPKVTVNLVGFIGNKKVNNGEDRGYIVNTASDMLPKYSVDGTGKTYPIEVNLKGSLIDRAFIDITEPKLDYVLIKQNGVGKKWCTPGELINVTAGDSLQIVDVKTNFTGGGNVSFNLSSKESNSHPRSYALGDTVNISELSNSRTTRYELTVMREAIVVGSTYLNVGDTLASGTFNQANR